MKGKTLMIVILLALLLATPALAREKEPTGGQINIAYTGSQTYPANTAFHIRHAWMELEPRYAVPGQFNFELEVDGVIVKPTFVEFDTTMGEYGPYLNKSFTFNFPEGMTGTHTFEGHWILACYVALYYGYVSECANPMADYDWHYSEVVVEFTP
jgi:hypothetical protein